jgi:predicted dehydrogenase
VRPDTEVRTFEPVDQYTIQAERFARSVLEGEPLPIPTEDALGNLRTIERVFAAAG